MDMDASLGIITNLAIQSLSLFPYSKQLLTLPLEQVKIRKNKLKDPAIFTGEAKEKSPKSLLQVPSLFLNITDNTTKINDALSFIQGREKNSATT